MAVSGWSQVKLLKLSIAILSLTFVAVAGWGICVLLSSISTQQSGGGAILAHSGTPIAPETIDPKAIAATQDPVLHATFMAEKYPEPGSPAFLTKAAAVAPYQGNSNYYSFEVGVWLGMLVIIFVILVALILLLRARLRKN
jgi:hypothetical protein